MTKNSEIAPELQLRHYSAHSAFLIAVMVSAGRSDEEALAMAASFGRFNERLITDLGSGEEILAAVHEALGR